LLSGVPNPGFIDGLLRGDIASKSEGLVEDIVAMTEVYPVWNPYWEERGAKVEDIECPLYVVASWTNALHTAGAIRAYRRSGSKQK
jgi:predicted acyl esterase